MGDHPSSPSLSPRLERLLDLAAKGVPDKAIATALGVSTHTVDASWRRLRAAFGAANRAETIARHTETRHKGRVAEMCGRIGTLEREAETLREANARLTAALENRDASIVTRFEADARAALADLNRQDQFRRLEQAVEASDTVVYEGEIGGLWRKHWVTENCARFGFTAASFASGEARIADYIPGQDVLAMMQAFEQALANGAERFVAFYRVRRPEGTYCWIRDCMTILRDETGEPVRYYGVATDVTDLAEHCDPALILHPAG